MQPGHGLGPGLPGAEAASVLGGPVGAGSARGWGRCQMLGGPSRGVRAEPLVLQRAGRQAREEGAWRCREGRQEARPSAEWPGSGGQAGGPEAVGRQLSGPGLLLTHRRGGGRAGAEAPLQGGGGRSRGAARRAALVTDKEGRGSGLGLLGWPCEGGGGGRGPSSTAQNRCWDGETRGGGAGGSELAPHLVSACSGRPRGHLPSLDGGGGRAVVLLQVSMFVCLQARPGPG